MDINPYEYQDSSKFEFARFHLKQGTRLLILMANWLQSTASLSAVHNYWVNRLMPLSETDCHFVCCNRIGKEKGENMRGCVGGCCNVMKSIVSTLL